MLRNLLGLLETDGKYLRSGSEQLRPIYVPIVQWKNNCLLSSRSQVRILLGIH